MSLAQLATIPKAFRHAIIIDCDGTPVQFGKVVESWQDRDFDAIDPALRSLVGQKIANPIRRFFWERPRGHAKTSGIAMLIVWILFASRRSIRVVAAAADRDQAALLIDAVRQLIKLNPWLGEILKVQRDRKSNQCACW